MRLLECRLEIEDLDAFVSELNGIGDRHGTTVQTFDARYVADHRHVERAVELADRATERGENIARNRAVEILLYAAGRRQINRALEMGVGEGENRAVVLIDEDGNKDGDEDEDTDADAEAATVDAIEALDAFVERVPILDDRRSESTAGTEPDSKVLQSFFEITEAERTATDASLAALVRERVALLEVEK